MFYFKDEVFRTYLNGKVGIRVTRSLLLALILLSFIWGGSYLFIKILLEDFGPWTIAFFRSTLGLAVITLLMLLARKPFGLNRIAWVPMTVMALIHTAVPWAIIGFSEQRLTSSMASVLNATTPLWTLLVGVLYFKRGANRLQWLGMGISAIGLLILLDIGTDSAFSTDLLGFIGMLAASLCYAIGSQLSKRLSDGLSMYQVTFGTLLCAALGSGSIAFASEPITLAPLQSAPSFGALLGLGIFGSGFAYVLYYYLVQKGSPELASTVTYLLPACSLIWGAAILNEAIHWRLLAGLVCILSGVILVGRTYAKTKPRKIGPEAESVMEGRS